MNRSEFVLAAMAALAVSACNASSSLYGGGGGGGNGGGGGGGIVGHVTVGNTFFQSDHNGSRNPAVDTIAAGTSVTWTWGAAGTHSVASTGTPSFQSSAVMSASGDTYSVTFSTAGTYTYDCSVHGQAMNGRIVVQ